MPMVSYSLRPVILSEAEGSATDSGEHADVCVTLLFLAQRLAKHSHPC